METVAERAGRAKMRSVFLFIALLIGAQRCEAASAAVLTKDAIQYYENGDVYTKVFIHGISVDLAWTNAELESFGTKRIYCEPRGSSISLDERVDMLKRFVDRFPDMNKFPVDMVLMTAMKEALPCDD